NNAKDLRCTLRRNFDHFICSAAFTITYRTATQQDLDSRHDFALNFHRASMEANVSHTVLSTAIHTSADLDTDFFVVNELRIFVVNHRLQYTRKLHGV